jgi:hypothetical protein
MSAWLTKPPHDAATASVDDHGGDDHVRHLWAGSLMAPVVVVMLYLLLGT